MIVKIKFMQIVFYTLIHSLSVMNYRLLFSIAVIILHEMFIKSSYTDVEKHSWMSITSHKKYSCINVNCCFWNCCFLFLKFYSFVLFISYFESPGKICWKKLQSFWVEAISNMDYLVFRLLWSFHCLNALELSEN